MDYTAEGQAIELIKQAERLRIADVIRNLVSTDVSLGTEVKQKYLELANLINKGLI